MGIFSELFNILKCNFNLRNKFESLLKIENNHYYFDSSTIDRIIKEAKKQIATNSRSFGLLVQKKLEQNNILKKQVEESLKDPEKLQAVSQANKIASLTKNEELRNTLSSLVVQKIITNEDEESIIITKAIDVIKNITVNHIKLLALFYLYKNGTIKKWLNDNKLEEKQKEYSDLFNLLDKNNYRLGNTLVAESLVIYTGLYHKFKYHISKDLSETKILNITNEQLSLSNTEILIQKLYKPIFQASLTNKEFSSVGEYIAKIYLQNLEQICCAQNKTF